MEAASWERPERPAPGEYRSLHIRGLLAARWQLLLILASTAVALVEVLELRTLDRPIDLQELDSADHLRTTVGLIEIAVLLIGVVIFLFWFNRAYKNAAALGPWRLEHGTGWSVGAWFVPILTWFRPKQIANEAWRAGDPGSGDVSGLGQLPVSPLVHWWWAAWVVASIAGNISFRLHEDTVDQLRTSLTFDIVAEGLSVIAGVLVILVIRRLTDRQEERALGLL